MDPSCQCFVAASVRQRRRGKGHKAGFTLFADLYGAGQRQQQAGGRADGAVGDEAGVIVFHLQRERCGRLKLLRAQIKGQQPLRTAPFRDQHALAAHGVAERVAGVAQGAQMDPAAAQHQRDGHDAVRGVRQARQQQAAGGVDRTGGQHHAAEGHGIEKRFPADAHRAVLHQLHGVHRAAQHKAESGKDGGEPQRGFFRAEGREQHPYAAQQLDGKTLQKAAAGQNAPTRVVDTAASAFALPKPIGLWTLLVPLVLCLLPMALPGLPRGLMLVCGIDAACVLLLWGLGRWTFRRREDMVTEDSARNQTLLRVRRLYWDRFWRLNLWAMALLNLFLILGYRSEAAILGLSLGFTVLLLAGSLWMEFSVRRAQAALTETAPIVADEDDAWVGGIFYYTPTDKRFLVAKRIGLGSTVNLGTWAGKLYYAFVGLVLVVCLAIGPIFGIVDSIPVRLELSGSAPVCLVASHGQSEKYRLDTDAITDVQLRDTLPDAARTWGTGMDHYLQGDFYVIGEGNARFCLDPTQKCFLRVEAGGQVYWFTGDSEDHTAAIAQALQSTVHP